MLTLLYDLVLMCTFVFQASKKNLKDMEQKLSISTRWTSSDVEYKEVEHALLTNKREQMLLAMWKAAKRRLFLLRLKAKYAGTYNHSPPLHEPNALIRLSYRIFVWGG